MPDFPRFAEIHRVFRDTIVTESQDRVSITAVDRDGADANLIGAGGAAMVEEGIATLADVESGFWLDSARGARLRRLLYDRYQIQQKSAAAAFVYLHFTTTAPVGVAFSIPSSTTVQTPDGVEFITLSTTSFPAGATGPVAVLARSSLAGQDQNVDEDSLTSITKQIPNAPADLRVTNPAAASGGAPAETDAQARARGRLAWKGARRGTRAAIESGALAVPGVQTVYAFEGLTGPAYPSRMVSLVVSDEFTDALVQQGVGSDPRYAAKSQALSTQVLAGLDEYRAFGIPVYVSVAKVSLLSVILRMRYQAAAASNTDAINLLARTEVVNLINGLVGGQVFDPADAIRRLRTVPGLDVRGDEIAAPSGVVVPSSNFEVLRTSIALVTVDGQATLQAVAPNFVTAASSAAPV